LSGVESPEESLKMEVWEYAVLEFYDGVGKPRNVYYSDGRRDGGLPSGIDGFAKTLGTLGHDGWEAVAMASEGHPHYQVLLKRRR
jgi:hypothetical protein